MASEYGRKREKKKKAGCSSQIYLQEIRGFEHFRAGDAKKKSSKGSCGKLKLRHMRSMRSVMEERNDPHFNF